MNITIALFCILSSLFAQPKTVGGDIDGAGKLDEANPAKTQSNDSNVVDYHGYLSSSSTPMNDTYPQSGGTLYLNLIWHQHQPLYLDPQSDQLQGPWVRTHGTKDYYDMASILEQYPNIHYNVNLTSSLLFQLEKYYVDRLRPFVDVKKNRVDTAGFFAHWKGKTDPWIDLALKPTKDFDARDMNFLLYNIWNAFGISDVQILRFPGYDVVEGKIFARRVNCPSRNCASSNFGSTWRILTLISWKKKSGLPMEQQSTLRIWSKNATMENIISKRRLPKMTVIASLQRRLKFFPTSFPSTKS